jgi:hypothetical protein
VSKKQQERKKKSRELIAKKRVLARRKALRKQTSEQLSEARLEKKFRNKIEPIVKDPEKQKIMQEQKNQRILSKLEKNAEILKALEEQYEEEMNCKKDINKKLEEEGNSTLKEKLDALDKKARENMTEAEKETGIVDLTKTGPQDFSNYC